MVLILGKGITGQSFISYCKRNKEEYTVYDDNDPVEIDFSSITKVYTSPGFPLDHGIFKKIKANIYSDFNLIENKMKDKYVIAVTGTNGKSTIVSMIYHVLKNSNLNVLLGGNIGIPVLSLGDADIYVFEISSYQLFYISSFPYDISVITNLSIHHIETYKTIENYHQTKMRILNSTKKNSLKFIGGINIPDNNNELAVRNILSLVPFNVNTESIKTFNPLEHRIEEIKYKNITLINDSKSTNRFSSMYALEKYALDKENIIWLIGGRSNSFNWTEEIDIKKIYFGELYDKSCREAIDLAVEIMKNDNRYNKILFSPSGQSFDEFKNFEERGKFFKEYALCSIKKHF